MLLNDIIIFDYYYSINSAKRKEIMVHFFIQPRHIFIRIKAFILIGGLQILIISTSFAWRLVSSMIKCCVLTACGHMNCQINKWLFFFVNIWLLISSNTVIYAIVTVKTLKVKLRDQLESPLERDIIQKDDHINFNMIHVLIILMYLYVFTAKQA